MSHLTHQRTSPAWDLIQTVVRGIAPINLQTVVLAHHPHRPFVQYLLNRITYGFWIGYNRSHNCRQLHGNMRSAIVNPKPVKDYLETEILVGRNVGTLVSMPFVKTSRFGVTPKHNQPIDCGLV